jgi:predicted TIM-barrel fold metal-dependent hydrolase
MIVDTHVHAVEAPSAERPHDPKGSPAHTLSVEDLFNDARAAGVDKIVQVVPSAMGWDNRYGFEIADKYPDKVVGVIMRFDPFAPDLEARLRAAKEHKKMLGVRFTLTSAETGSWLKEGKLDPFFAAAEKIDTAVQLFAPYLVKESQETVRRYPKLRWLIDHMGLRYYAGKDNTQSFRQWPELLKLAQEPNAWIKCSYFPEAAKDIEQYPYPTAQAKFKELYESAGPSKLVWGSNYPPVTRACTYKQSVDWAVSECTFFKPADREAMLGGNFLKYFAR